MQTQGGLLFTCIRTRSLSPDIHPFEVSSGLRKQILSINGVPEHLPHDIHIILSGRATAALRGARKKPLWYRSKKTKRNFGRNIKHGFGKALAESQPHIRGRFAEAEE